METFFQNLITNIKTNVGISDIIDILLVAYLIYRLLGFIRATRAEQLAKGLLVLVILTLISQQLHFYTLHWILSGIMTVGVLALVIIFQPELRRLLENIGRSRFTNFLSGVDKDVAKKMIAELISAVQNMSQSKTGALIVIERETSLNDIIETGTVIDSSISSQLVENVFYKGSPLHDGALIIRADRLYAAGCVLPLTQNKKLSKDLGTRHRAGIGITENSDAYVIIVSEETGIISVAQDGELTRFLDGKAVEKALYGLYFDQMKETVAQRVIRAIKGAPNGKE